MRTVGVCSRTANQTLYSGAASSCTSPQSVALEGNPTPPECVVSQARTQSICGTSCACSCAAHNVGRTSKNCALVVGWHSKCRPTSSVMNLRNDVCWVFSCPAHGSPILSAAPRHFSSNSSRGGLSRSACTFDAMYCTGSSRADTFTIAAATRKS